MALAALAIAACDGKDSEALPGGEPVPPTPAPDAPAPDAKAEEDQSGPFVPQVIAATDPHPFGVRDLLAMDRISSPAIAPDGSQVAFSLRETDLEGDRGRTDIWVQKLDGGDARRLTRHLAGDSSPVWSSDGKTLYFLSSRSGSNQVWSLDPTAESPTPTAVTELPLDVEAFQLSPDGKRLVVALSVFPDCDSLDCTTKRLAEREKGMGAGRVYDEMFVRHWDQWKDGRRSHLFGLELGKQDAVDLMAGMDADCPTKPFGGGEDFAIGPDGTVVFTARDVGREEPWSTNFDLFAVPIAGGEPDKLTADNPAWDAHPVFSPDGSKLAYVAMERAGFEADRFRILIRDQASGEAKVVTQDWDRSASSMAWSPDGKRLLVVAQDTGHRPLFAVDPDSGDATKLVGEGTIGSASQHGEAIYFLRSDLNHPTELWKAAADGSGVEQVTHLNDTKIAAASTGEAEQFSFKGAGGDTVHGWIVKPVDFQEGETYPLAFLIHGGPQGSFGNNFHYRWNPQTYAGAGYVAVMIDFHGSTGYGQDFTDSITDDWGGKPLEDLKLGLAHVKKTYPFVDTERACALGASYGGFMINWVAGNWPDQFDCLVNHDGIFDQRMMYYATEELWFPEWEHRGPYYASRDAYEKHNPADHVTRWKSPMLVVHGALDFRVPLEQGLATFTALQRRGVESRLLVYERENHWVLKPRNSIQWHDEVQRWLDAHTKG